MKTAKYIAGIIITLATPWLNAQINPSTNNIVGGTNTSVAGGDFNKAVAMYGFIGSGFKNTNTAFMGTIGGGWKNVAETDVSTIPGGRGAKTRSYGQLAYSSGFFDTMGDGQFGLYTLRGITVGVQSVGLALDDSSLLTIGVPANGSFLFDIDIVARSGTKVNGWYGNFFHYRYAVENQNGALAIQQIETSSFKNHNTSMTPSFGSSGNAFQIHGNGEAGETVYWVATVRATELVKTQ